MLLSSSSAPFSQTLKKITNLIRLHGNFNVMMMMMMIIIIIIIIIII
jgi:hypothetical protein